MMVKGINPGAGGSSPGALTNFNGTLYFSANDGTHGFELWKSDGTAAGTMMVKDINPGAGGSSPGALTNFNGTLYFSANDGTHGFELWKSDGTAAGTTMVKDIAPLATSSSPQSLTALNGRSISTPTTVPMAMSSGSRTGPPPERCCSRTSILARTTPSRRI
jgi:trimeric autotransporter adhesin